MHGFNIAPLRLALAGLLLTLALVAVRADPAKASLLFQGPMDGAQEVPPTPSAGTGTAIVVLNDAEDTAFISVSFSNLLGTQIDAHIHGPAVPGVDGPVVFPLPLGSFTTLPWALTPTDVTNLKAGLLYVNVHTDLHPGGELRGQLLPASVGGTVRFASGESEPVPASTARPGGSSFPFAPLAAAVAGVSLAAIAAGGWLLRTRLIH
jgi:hypothetical protein